MSSLKITNKTLLIRKQQKSSPDQGKVLRDQLHKEIEINLKICGNTTYECSLACIDGFNHCIKHILLDSNAPYKQCEYVYTTNSKQCGKAAPIYGKTCIGVSNYCFEHSRHSQLVKTKSVMGKFKQIESSETLVNSLTHHVKVDKSRTHTNSTSNKISANDDEEEEIDVVTPAVDPFVHINASEFNNLGKTILGYASDSSSEDEETTVGNTWRGHEQDNSEAESIDSEDLLKHAGIYTLEEATLITKAKLTTLNSLYMDQYKRLHHVLQDKRRQYLHAIKKEKETLSSIHDQAKDSPQERKLYEKLKAYKHYHHRFGVESLLHRQYMEKRAKITEGLTMPVNKNTPKCSYTEGGVKCGQISIPACKFCRKHILEDKKQVLFKACNIEKGGMVCQEPVVHILEDSSCILHIELPVPRTYTKRKYESETDEEEDTKVEDFNYKVEQGANEDFESALDVNIIENNVTISHSPEDSDLKNN